jgi:hypothetical protein
VLVNTTGGECSRSELHKTLNLQPYGEEELEVTRPAMFSKSKKQGGGETAEKGETAEAVGEGKAAEGGGGGEAAAGSWQVATAEDGQLYYWHDVTKETTWERPASLGEEDVGGGKK